MTQAPRPWLAPLVPIYRFGTALRGLALRTGLEPIRRLRSPVVSIGNLSTGGAGKTPLAIALARALKERGVRADVLSRGFGRTGKAAARVDPNGTAEEFGDEPLVIARQAGVPVYVAAQRYQAGLLAEKELAVLQSEPLDDVSGHDFSRAEGAQKKAGALATAAPGPAIHLLDDGFQHCQLHRDVDILLLTGNDLQDRLLPAGNLREPLDAMRRATVVALTMPETPINGAPSPGAPSMEQTLRSRGLWQGPVWRLHRRLQVPIIEGPVVAFCGIARPGQFFAGLENPGVDGAGLHVASRIAFADHHRFSQHDIDCILDAARSCRAVALVTTEKDRVRLGRFFSSLAAALPIETAGLRIEIEDEASVLDWLIAHVANGSITP